MIILHSYESSRGSLLGDSICGIPVVTALTELAQARGEDVYYDCPNADVAALMPKKLGLKSIYEMPSGGQHMVHRISIHDLFARFQHQFHPTVGLCVMQGISAGQSGSLRPEIEFERVDVPVYDIIISPFSRANGVRMMPIAHWDQVLLQFSDLKIAVVGATGEPQAFIQKNVSYEYGRPIHEVCSLLEAAKLVVTIDNGIGRLMSALTAQHLLLCSNAVQANWGLYDTNYIFDHPKNFNVNGRVVSAIRSLLNV